MSLWKSILWVAWVLGATGCSFRSIHAVKNEHQGVFDSKGNSNLSNRSDSQKRWGILRTGSEDSVNGPDWESISRELKKMHWPLRKVRISSAFGQRGGTFHEGVDLRAKSGTPVYAAQSGMVLYAHSRVRGYGKLVVLRHFGNLATIYAHNSRILVRSGMRVRRGQLIAYSGNTGRSTGPHLHFEVRHGVDAMNPALWVSQISYPDHGSGKKTKTKLTSGSYSSRARSQVN